MWIEARVTQRGRTAPAFQIDEQFFEEVNKWKWFAVGGGYMRGRVNGKAMQLSRYIWLLHTGKHPAQEIDHINRDRLDNRVENLREASRSENCKNKSPGWGLGRRVTRKSLLPVGVRSHRRASGLVAYSASVKLNRKARHLGMFATPEEASARYQQEIARIRNGEQ